MAAIRPKNIINNVPFSRSVVLPRVVQQTASGRGRPRKEVKSRLLRSLFKAFRNISVTKAARILGMHRNTLARKMREYGISHSYSNISDEELDNHLRQFRLSYPKSGYRYFTGYLRAPPRRLRVQRERIRAAILRVDGVGARLRARDPIIRKSYENPRPNAVWHVDGHMKAGLYGITVHGFIDGYSRKVGT